MSNPLAIASFEARSAGLRMAWAELLLLSQSSAANTLQNTKHRCIIEEEFFKEDTLNGKN